MKDETGGIETTAAKEAVNEHTHTLTHFNNPSWWELVAAAANLFTSVG